MRKIYLFFYFAGVFIILDFGISFSLTIHFYLLTKQRYQIWNSFSFVIPHNTRLATPKSGSVGWQHYFRKQNKKIKYYNLKI